MITTLFKKIMPKTVLFEDCNDTTLFIWLEIIRTKNLKLLVKKGSAPKDDVLEKRLEFINEEFQRLREQKNMVTEFDKIQYREQLILKVRYCSALVTRLVERVDDNLIFQETFEGMIRELKSWGFRLNRDKPLHEELEKLVSELNSLQTTIDVLTEELFPEKEEKQVDDIEKSVLDFHRMLISYQKIAGIGSIDIEKTTLVKFIAIEQNVKQIINAKSTENV